MAYLISFDIDGTLEFGDPPGGITVEMVRRAVRRNYFVVPTLTQSPQFDGARDHPSFRALLAEAEAGRRHALEAFRQAGGEKFLGSAAAQAESEAE